MDGSFAFRQILQSALRIAKIHLPSIRQPRNSPGSVEELGTQAVLQLPDLLRQGGLGKM